MNISHPKHDCTEELHSANLRATPARLTVLDIFEHAQAPIDVSTVVRALEDRQEHVDEVTVFRIINTFCEKGIVKPIHLNENKLRYEYADKPKHHHFICEKCGDITDVEGCMISKAQKQIEQAIGGKVFRHSLEFFGLCKRCVI